jgi:cell division protein ZapA
MSRRTVVLTVGSREYKVVSSASPEELSRLADVVTSKLATVVPAGRPEPPQALLLAALALAHELEEEQARARGLERKSRDLLRRVLVRLDNVLELDEGSPGAG